MDKPRRKMQDKELFLEGNRQKWLVVFLIAGGIVLVFDVLGKIHEINSYFTFLTFLSGAFILGYSGTETMKLFRVTSNSETLNENKKEEVNIEEKSYLESKQTITIQHPLTHNAKEEGYKI